MGEIAERVPNPEKKSGWVEIRSGSIFYLEGLVFSWSRTNFAGKNLNFTSFLAKNHSEKNLSWVWNQHLLTNFLFRVFFLHRRQVSLLRRRAFFFNRSEWSLIEWNDGDAGEKSGRRDFVQKWSKDRLAFQSEKPRGENSTDRNSEIRNRNIR